MYYKNAARLFLVLCALSVSVSFSYSQTEVKYSLDLFYTDNSGDNTPDSTAAGAWQLYALLSEGEGLAAAGVQITGMTGSHQS